jgi:hypothetical protein
MLAHAKEHGGTSRNSFGGNIFRKNSAAQNECAQRQRETPMTPAHNCHARNVSSAPQHRVAKFKKFGTGTRLSIVKTAQQKKSKPCGMLMGPSLLRLPCAFSRGSE